MISIIFEKLRNPDRAVLYTFLLRITQLVLGPIVILAVATQLSATEQGFYFVFISLLKLKGLVDLGLAPTSSQILAHSFANLSYSRSSGIHGDQKERDEFLATSKFLVRFFRGLAVVFVVLVGFIGHIFLSYQESGNEVSWQSPWWALVGFSSLTFGLAGGKLVALGSNQVATVQKVTFWTQVIALLLFIGILHLGGGLWASVGMAAGEAIGLVVLNVLLGKPFFKQLKGCKSVGFSYRERLLPLQTRNAITFGAGFLVFYSFTPFTMAYCGAAAAGVVGMSIQITNMVHGLATIWMGTRVPLMGNYAGARNDQALSDLFRKGSVISLAGWFVFGGAAIATMAVAEELQLSMSDRFGGPLEMVFWMLGAFGFLWCYLRGLYVRAHCREPFAVLNIIQALATAGLLCGLLPVIGRLGAPLAYAVAMLGAAVGYELIYRAFRRDKDKNFDGEVPDASSTGTKSPTYL